MDRCETILAHALPSVIDVQVTDEDGVTIAKATGLKADGDTPMGRLTISEGSIERRQIWPTAEDMETPVLLAGGEVGILTSWWNADDHREWRWSVELSNRV